MSATILDEIVETKRGEVAASRKAVPLDTLTRAAASAPPARDFYAVVTSGPSIRLIAEIKKSSPSAGLIRADFDPVSIARIYRDCGAAALSVLTDRTYFSGDLSHVAAVRQCCDLPVLRKDFIIESYQVYESRAAQADAILLIADVLSPRSLGELARLTNELGMSTLIEVHDADRLADALPLLSRERRTLLGINNRDLRVQCTNLQTTLGLAQRLPDGTPFVAESGIRTHDDVLEMRRAGACAVLIGETFMRAADIAAEVRSVMGEADRSRVDQSRPQP